jgi:hypothetical protein
MKEVIVFSAGLFFFGLPVEDVQCIEKQNSNSEFKNLQVQNLHAGFSEQNKDAGKPGCWIMRKTGDLLGVTQVLGLGEVETVPLPLFIKQNIRVGAIKSLARFEKKIIFLFED